MTDDGEQIVCVMYILLLALLKYFACYLRLVYIFYIIHRYPQAFKQWNNLYPLLQGPPTSPDLFRRRTRPGRRFESLWWLHVYGRPLRRCSPSQLEHLDAAED